jgi:hypothetical protein
MVLNCAQMVQILVKSDKVYRRYSLYMRLRAYLLQNLFLGMIDKMVHYL